MALKYLILVVLATVLSTGNSMTIVEENEKVMQFLLNSLNQKGFTDIGIKDLFEESIVDIFPDETRCVIRAVASSDQKTQENFREFVEEAMHWVDLQVQRDAALLECDQIGAPNPSIIQIQQQRICRTQTTATYGAQITISNVKLRALVLQMNSIWLPFYRCVRHLL